MNEATLRVLLQAIASFAIAGGLIYTAFQFRAAQHAQYVTNFTKLVELQMGLRRMRVEDPALASVYRHDDAAGDTPDEVRMHFFNLMQLSLFEIAWFSHQNRQLPEGYFQSWLRYMRVLAAEPSFQQMWTSNTTKITHDEFRQYIDALVGQAGTVPECSTSCR